MNDEKMNTFLQRQIEARFLSSIIEELSEKYGKDALISKIRKSVEKIAFENGKDYAKKNPGSLNTLAKHWERLAEGDALVIDGMTLSESRLDFSITRCRYADFYKESGIEELGDTISCCRDNAFLNGFSDQIKMYRSKTILDGNPVCKFSYELIKDIK